MSTATRNNNAFGGFMLAVALLIYAAIAEFSAWLGVDLKTGAEVCIRLAVCGSIALALNVLLPGILSLRNWPIYLACVWAAFWPALSYKGTTFASEGVITQIWWATSFGQWTVLVFIILSGYALNNAFRSGS